MVNNERRDRYVRAIFCGDDGGVGEAALHLVMAVADAELAELRAEVERWQQKWKRRGMVIENLRPAAHDLQELRTHWLSEFERAEAAEAKVARVEALADDMDERGRPGANDSAHDATSRRQLREDVKRLRAALNGPPELEYPDLAYAVQKGGPNLDGPTVLTDEPTGDAMRWTKDDK